MPAEMHASTRGTATPPNAPEGTATIPAIATPTADMTQFRGRASRRNPPIRARYGAPRTNPSRFTLSRMKRGARRGSSESLSHVLSVYSATHWFSRRFLAGRDTDVVSYAGGSDV